MVEPVEPLRAVTQLMNIKLQPGEDSLILLTSVTELTEMSSRYTYKPFEKRLLHYAQRKINTHAKYLHGNNRY